MGSAKVKSPEPSVEERALQREQVSLLKQQRADTEAFKPILLESMGLRDAGGGKFEKIPWEERLARMDPQERLGYDLATRYYERQTQAMEGKLPVSPAMDAELAQQKSELEANLSRRLGPNWQMSTPGIQTMTEFEKRAELLREEARRGQINTGEGLIGARMGLLGNQQAQKYQQAQGWDLPQFSSIMGGYSSALQPYQFNRQMEYDARKTSMANKMGLYSGAMQLLGTAGGMAAGGGFGGAAGAGLGATGASYLGGINRRSSSPM